MMKLAMNGRKAAFRYAILTETLKQSLSCQNSLKKFCKEKEVKKIYTVSSDHPTIIRIFEHLGFKREEVEEIVYEKILTKL